MIISFIPDSTSSSMIYCSDGLSTITNISLGCALVAGNTLVPSPAAGITAFVTFINYFLLIIYISNLLKTKNDGNLGLKYVDFGGIIFPCSIVFINSSFNMELVSK